MSRRDVECKVYVGDLDKNVDEKDIEDAFSRYGKLKNVWVARAPPGFAFVEYEKNLDAEDAVKEMDGQDLCGSRIRVELSTGKSRPKPWLRRGGGGGGGGGYGGDRGYRGGGGGGGRYGDDMKCFECNRTGHIARDCPIRRRDGGGGGGGRRDRDRYSRSRSRSPRRSRYSRSRSRDRY